MRFSLAVLALSLAPVVAAAEESGSGLFHAYCAGCHGATAQGDGPIAALLSVEVPDLTRLAARHGGSFPVLGSIAVMEGERRLPGHGGPMPVFLQLKSSPSVMLDGPDGSIVQTHEDVLSIVNFLQTIQD